MHDIRSMIECVTCNIIFNQINDNQTGSRDILLPKKMSMQMIDLFVCEALRNKIILIHGFFLYDKNKNTNLK